MQTISRNGFHLAYDRCGQGTPLVLLHGYPLDHSIWAPVVPFLEKDFDLILPDLRGFGASSTLDAPYTIADLAADIATLLDALGIEKAAIAGHSMGGYVALAFAKNYPERVLSLALVASQTAADAPERKEIRYKTAADVQIHGVEIVANAMTDKLASVQSVREAIRPLILRQGTAGVTGALRAMAEREDLTSFISGFQKPLLLVHGDADELISVERAREVKTVNPAAHLIELTGVGHMPMMEQPEQTAAALLGLK